MENLWNGKKFWIDSTFIDTMSYSTTWRDPGGQIIDSPKNCFQLSVIGSNKLPR